MRVLGLSEPDLAFLQEELLEVDDFVPDVPDPPHHQVPQEGGILLQLLVMGVMVPTLDRDPVLRLALEVLLNVIYDDGLPQIPSQPGQVLLVDSILVMSLVSVQAVRDEAVLIQMVQDPVSILLQASGEHHQLKVLAHLTQERQHSWSRLVGPDFWIEMHQSLI